MKKIKSVEEAETSGLPENVRAVATRLVEDLIRIYRDEIGAEWDPEVDGYVVVIEATDKPDDPEIVETVGYLLHEAPFEGVTYEDGCFLTCVLWNNDAGLTIAIVDHEDLDPRLRAVLEADLVSEAGDG
ncbi:hypothetical protein FDZ71_10720 [bacterium]|nr:MAG: hypothetical protein FDZ71_10720 [bacterium]